MEIRGELLTLVQPSRAGSTAITYLQRPLEGPDTLLGPTGSSANNNLVERALKKAPFCIAMVWLVQFGRLPEDFDKDFPALDGRVVSNCGCFGLLAALMR